MALYIKTKSQLVQRLLEARDRLAGADLDEETETSNPDVREVRQVIAELSEFLSSEFPEANGYDQRQALSEVYLRLI